MQALKTLYRFASLISIRFRCVHSYIYRMDKVYVRCSTQSGVFELSFHYNNSLLGIDRQFNFNRKLDENVTTFLSRISTNLEKVINKNQKKKNLGCTPKLKLESKIQLYLNGNEVAGKEICRNIFTSEGLIYLKLENHVYHVLINSPWVKTISLPTSILANYPLYPSKIETLFTEPELCDYEWFRSSNKVDWQRIGEGFIYYPNKSDIGSLIKVCCIPRNNEEFGPRTEVVSECIVQAGPGLCPFESRHKFTQTKLSGKNFRVVSYNVLADINCNSENIRTVFYPYCPPNALQIDYRKQLILKELMGFNADIICLQEVDDKVFKNDFKPILKIGNFEGIYTKKYGNSREGGASFYDRRRFKLFENISMVYRQELSQNKLFASIWNKISSNTSLTRRIFDLGTTLQILILKVIGFDEILLVANTHLYFHPDADHIRLLQGGMALIYIEYIMKQAQNKYKGMRVSVIFCGDFNSVPSCGVYDLYTRGSVDTDHPDWKSNLEERVEGLCLTNLRLMKSACGEPKYTNFTQDFRDCLDYIFYEPNKFTVTQSVPLLSVEQLKAHTAIPSIVVPSDHVSLIADLQLKE